MIKLAKQIVIYLVFIPNVLILFVIGVFGGVKYMMKIGNSENEIIEKVDAQLTVGRMHFIAFLFYVILSASIYLLY